MAQRSPYNDRYKVEQKGKTKRSASAAKPKRAIADVTPGEAAKSTKKQSRWARAKAASVASSKSSSKTSSKASGKELVRAIENTPRMKELRRIWWWMWGGALGIAVALWLLQDAAQRAGAQAEAAATAASNATTATIAAAGAGATSGYAPFLLIGWFVWLVAMGGAFYLEFMPIRKERARVLAESRGGSKGSDKKPATSDNAVASAKSKKTAKAAKPAAEDDAGTKDAE